MQNRPQNFKELHFHISQHWCFTNNPGFDKNTMYLIQPLLAESKVARLCWFVLMSVAEQPDLHKQWRWHSDLIVCSNSGGSHPCSGYLPSSCWSLFLIFTFPELGYDRALKEKMLQYALFFILKRYFVIFSRRFIKIGLQSKTEIIS